MASQEGGSEHDREVAIKRLKEKRDFRMHLGTYVIINGMLIGIWAMSGRGHFWPMWVMLFWGVGIVFHGWNTFFGKEFTEADIQREMGRRK